ncbi:MAG: circadian clock KaiB family protein [Sediminibacterium sp.]|nr:circadian clock KaiB family protein [Sediminibacterium sp.]
MKKTSDNIASSTKEFETAVKLKKKDHYVLKLYVSGSTINSISAIKNIKTICEENFQNRYDLEVIDLYQNPNLASGEQIIAAPTLIKKLPLPLRRIIGNLSSKEKVLIGLDIKELHAKIRLK